MSPVQGNCWMEIRQGLRVIRKVQRGQVHSRSRVALQCHLMANIGWRHHGQDRLHLILAFVFIILGFFFIQDVSEGVGWISRLARVFSFATTTRVMCRGLNTINFNKCGTGILTLLINKQKHLSPNQSRSRSKPKSKCKMRLPIALRLV